MKLSHSSVNLYSTCGHAYKLKYIDGWSNLFKGSPLFFGSAIDECLNFMLLNKDSNSVLEDSKSVFTTNWEKSLDKKGNATEMQRNPFVLYSKYDFDTDLLEKKDWALLFLELKNYNERHSSNFKSPGELKFWIDSQLKIIDFKDLLVQYRIFYNFCSWLSLNRKGHILIEEYYNSLLPHVKEVIKVQHAFELLDSEGNILNGVVDFICRMKDGTVVVADNKTSSMVYEPDSVRTSTQLSLYVKAMNILNIIPETIHHAAYFVVSKKINKDITKTCSKCGHIGEGSHKTCDNIIKDKRCGGEWDKIKKFSTNTQLIVDKTTDTIQDMVMENVDSVKNMIASNVFNKNLNSCHGKFGKCDFYNKCYENSDKNLIKKVD